MEESYNKKYDVFISYSRKDYADENNKIIPGNIVSKVKDTLDKMNVKYWFDEDGVYSGDEFAPLIARAIKNSEIFLFISSHNSNASDWTSNEIAVAHAYKKKIIPFRIDDSVFNESVIIYIAKLDYIDYTKNQEKAITRLKESIDIYLKHIAEKEKLAIEKKQKEEERLKKAQEKERELSRIRERLSNVSKELDSLRSQWQVSSTLYDELKAKEATLLGKPYQQTVLKLPESVGNPEKPSNENDNERINKSIFKRIADWFTNPNGKERAPWVSAIIRIVIIFGYIVAISRLYRFFDGNDFRFHGYGHYGVHGWGRFFLYSLAILVYCFSLQKALKWKRLPIYILILGLVLTIPLLFSRVLMIEHAIEIFCIILPFILAVTLILSSRYHGKSFFEQTEHVKDNLHDKQFITSMALECVLLTTLFIPAYLLKWEKDYMNNYNWWGDELVLEADSTAVEEALVDTVTVAPEEEAAPEEAPAPPEEAAPEEEATSKTVTIYRKPKLKATQEPAEALKSKADSKSGKPSPKDDRNEH